MLTIYRKAGLSDKTRAFHIIIDGKKIGKIKEGETYRFTCDDQNSHSLQLKIDWCSSPIHHFKGNDDISFHCQTCIQKKSQIFLSLFYIFFKATSYIQLTKQTK